MPHSHHSIAPWATRLLIAVLSLAVAVPTFLALAEPAAATPAKASASPASDEAEFFSLVNRERAAAGLPALASDGAAATMARGWSSTMAAQDRLYHNPNLSAQVSTQVTSAWTRVGENVGVGYAVGSLHDAFMASSGHRANILGDFNRVGVGEVIVGGRIWVTFVFLKGPAIASAPFVAAGLNPVGSLDSATSGLGTVRVSGWGLDPDSSGSIQVHIYVGPVGTALTANTSRPDVGAAYPGRGNAHGFSSEVKVPSAPGSYNVCAYGINLGSGSNSLFGCRRVTIDRNPVGSIDRVSTSLGSVQLSGWAIDPDRSGPIDVHVWVGGVGSVLPANRYRGDLQSVFPSFGGGHGFSGSVRLPATSGVYDMCAYGINQGPGGNRLLGCRKVSVERNPLGSIDTVRRVAGGVRVSGWSLDPDTSAPIQVHTYVGSRGTATQASRGRADIARVFPGFGDRHGFDVVVPTGAAPTTVCVYGINTGPGGNRLLGCRVV